MDLSKSPWPEISLVVGLISGVGQIISWLVPRFRAVRTSLKHLWMPILASLMLLLWGIVPATGPAVLVTLIVALNLWGWWPRLRLLKERYWSKFDEDVPQKYISAYDAATYVKDNTKAGLGKSEEEVYALLAENVAQARLKVWARNAKGDAVEISPDLFKKHGYGFRQEQYVFQGMALDVCRSSSRQPEYQRAYFLRKQVETLWPWTSKTKTAKA